MGGKFLVVGSFHVRSRNLFVLVGDFVDGTAEPGAMVCVSLGTFGVSGRVSGVEVIEASYDARRYHGLVLAYDVPEELDFWNALDDPGARTSRRLRVPERGEA